MRTALSRRTAIVSFLVVASSLIFTPLAWSLVGATPGAFEVTPSGAATYRITIDVPPGTAGTQPTLALTYNSQGGNSLLGLGWSLEGLSAITRCPQTLAQDGNRTGITFTSADRFCLDGKRLIVVPGKGPYGAGGSEYRTEIDGFGKIVANGPSKADKGVADKER